MSDAKNLLGGFHCKIVTIIKVIIFLELMYLLSAHMCKIWFCIDMPVMCHSTNILTTFRGIVLL